MTLSFGAMEGEKYERDFEMAPMMPPLYNWSDGVI